MGLFIRNYPPAGYGGAPARRGFGFRNVLLLLGIVFGLYFLNLFFAWIVIPESVTTGIGKYINLIAGILLILLGLTTVIRSRA